MSKDYNAQVLKEEHNYENTDYRSKKSILCTLYALNKLEDI